MTEQRDWIDVGDRVVVTDRIAKPEHMRSARPEAAGQHGEVVSNDGWGLCRVQLDNGTRITAWNGIDLEWETP